MQDLGEAVKLTAANGGLNPDKTQEFMTKYAEKGGDIKNFNKFMIRATKNATQSAVDQMKMQVGSPLAQKQLVWLGADLPENLHASTQGQ
jgi:hypothetical protein